MDVNLMDKLRLLKLDTELRPQIKMKPMSRYYFVTSTNPAEQFFAFSCVAAWLSNRLGKHLDQPSEEDDPNAIIANIIDVLRQQEVTVDFPAHKLKQGYGDHVCYILNVLADQVLKKESFQWQQPVVDIPETEEPAEDVDQIEDETEILLEKVEEEMAIYSDDSEGEVEVVDDKESTKVHDWEEWKLELERVAPQLRLKIYADGRDWRARQIQMKTYRDQMVERFSATGTRLNKLHANVSSVMDKIAARENVLNEQFEPLINEYGSLLEEANKAASEYKAETRSLAEKHELLTELTTKLEHIKQRTESRGSSMNDDAPLVAAKQAVANVKTDIQEMDFQMMILLWLLTARENPSDRRYLRHTSRY